MLGEDWMRLGEWSGCMVVEKCGGGCGKRGGGVVAWKGGSVVAWKGGGCC